MERTEKRLHRSRSVFSTVASNTNGSSTLGWKMRCQTSRTRLVSGHNVTATMAVLSRLSEASTPTHTGSVLSTTTSLEFGSTHASHQSMSMKFEIELAN